MPSEVKLPRLGQGMESGTVVRWLKREGEQVERGEPLYELDTEKVTQEVEAEAAGVLLKIVAEEGNELPVGAMLAFIGEAGEEVPAISAPAEPEKAGKEPSADGRAERAEPARVPSFQPSEGRVKASPLARRLARDRGIDLAAIVGTGPEGRIVAEDVERAEAAPAPAAPAPAVPPAAAPAAGEVERIPLTSLRRTIARRLTEAWQVPVFQLQASAEMTRVLALLDRRRELDPDVRITVTDVLTMVCAAALMRHREVNAQFTEEELLLLPSANVGLAVATERGLVVPVIHGAEALTLAQIAAARADLVERARAGKLHRDDLDGGTFTISNLGMYAVERFTAILNPPQAAIVAVGTIEDRAVPVGGEVEIRPMSTLTATFDHRAVDGAPAAAFLETVKTYLEEPGLAL